MFRRRIVVIGLSSLITIGIFVGALNYFMSFGYLNLKLGSGVTAKIYADKSTEDHIQYDQKSPVATANSSQKIKLKKASYVVVSEASQDYEKIVSQAKISDKITSLEISPSYSKQKLDSLLVQEQDLIKQAISSKYPALAQSYMLAPGKLYAQGEWYGAKLTPLDPNTYDPRRIILEKKDNSWQIITDPPPIVVGLPVYPVIPRDVVSDVNNFL